MRDADQLAFTHESADGNGEERATEGAGQSATHAGLARSRWAHQAQNGSARTTSQEAHGEKLGDTLLHVFEPDVQTFEGLANFIELSGGEALAPVTLGPGELA